jgi:small ligand-binding sensory domain FIST
MAQERLGYKPDEALLKDGPAAPSALMQLLDGEAHIAFPVTGSDQRDYLVRNIMAIDPDNGMIAVGEQLEDGKKMMFVYRDDRTVCADLTTTLVNLQKRIVHERGQFTPKAALYVSCIARANVAFEQGKPPGGEMALLREILGDIPLAGFYANGEISNNRLYGYTGVLTLFL